MSPTSPESQTFPFMSSFQPIYKLFSHIKKKEMFFFQNIMLVKSSFTKIFISFSLWQNFLKELSTYVISNFLPSVWNYSNRVLNPYSIKKDLIKVTNDQIFEFNDQSSSYTIYHQHLTQWLHSSLGFFFLAFWTTVSFFLSTALFVSLASSLSFLQSLNVGLPSLVLFSIWNFNFGNLSQVQLFSFAWIIRKSIIVSQKSSHIVKCI